MASQKLKICILFFSFYLPLNNRSNDNPIDGFNARMNFRDEDIEGLSLSAFFLREGPPGATELLIDPDFELKMEELNEVSAAPNDRWPLWDVSCGGYPTAPS